VKKTSGIVTVVCGIFLIGILITIESRLRHTEERLDRAESALTTMEPLRQIFEGYQASVGARTRTPYQPTQATGSPDVGTGGRDSAFAWCPATEDGGEEWLLLDYGEAVMASALTIRATWNPGSVVRVLSVGENETEGELWSGPASGEAAGMEQEIGFAQPASLRRIKLVFDTAAVPGWNEIDAVGLVGADGQTRWAREATASSAWSRNRDGAPD
jgi:hypothetical protein